MARRLSLGRATERPRARAWALKRLVRLAHADQDDQNVRQLDRRICDTNAIAAMFRLDDWVKAAEATCVLLALAFYLRYAAIMPVKDREVEDLLSEPFDDALRHRLDGLVGAAEMRELARSVSQALDGNASAARLYVTQYRELTQQLLEVAARARPELLSIKDKSVVVLDPSGGTAGFLKAALDETAADAPFSRWAALRGLEEGVVLHALASLRSLLPDTPPLDPPVVGGVMPISELDTRQFLAAVRRSLNAQQPPLERIRDVFDLNYTELGSLFGVSRQGAKDWLERGVPTDRQDKVAAVAATVDLLERKLKADRIPGIARRPADAYDGQTMLELIAQDRHQELLNIIRRSFDWATAA